MTPADPRFIQGWSPNFGVAPPEPDEPPPEGGLARPQLFTGTEANRSGTTHDVLGRGRVSDGGLREALHDEPNYEPETDEPPPEAKLARPRLEFPDPRQRRA